MNRGIFLNYSPVHASSVPLVLNTSTACVSPQFHCLYDDEFATCKQDVKFRSYWQYKAKLKEGNQSLIELLTNNSTDSLPSPQNFEPPKIDLPIIFNPPSVTAEPSLTTITPVHIHLLPVQKPIPSQLSSPPLENPTPTPSNVPTPSINFQVDKSKLLFVSMKHHFHL